MNNDPKTSMKADMMSASPQPPFSLTFVVGPPRSGTTLLASLLSGGQAHPHLPECSIITDVIRERIRIESSQDALKFRTYLRDSDFADQIFSSTITNIIQGVVESSDNYYENIVLKDPSLIFFIRFLDRLIRFPKRILCIMRDPRDVISSYLEVRKRGGQCPPLDEAIQFILPFFEQILRFRSMNHRPVLVRYEDIVRRDSFVLQEISNFVGYSINVEAHSGVPPTSLDKTSAWYTPVYEQSVSERRISAHRNLLSQVQIARIEEAFEDIFRIFYPESWSIDAPAIPRHAARAR